MVIHSRVISSLTSKHKTKLERLVMDKHPISLQKLINYGGKKFKHRLQNIIVLTVFETLLLSIIMLNVILSNVILSNVILPKVVLPNVILPNVSLPNVILPYVILPNVILPNVILPKVVAPDEPEFWLKRSRKRWSASRSSSGPEFRRLESTH